jgi:hypothetical protein
VKWNELDTSDSAKEPVTGSTNHGNKASGPIKAVFYFGPPWFKRTPSQITKKKRRFYRAKILLCEGGLNFIYG